MKLPSESKWVIVDLLLDIHKVDGLAQLLADQPNDNSATYTDSYLLSDTGDAMSALSIGSYGQIWEEDVSHNQLG